MGRFFPRIIMGLITAAIALALYKSWTVASGSSIPAIHHPELIARDDASADPIAGLEVALSAAPDGCPNTVVVSVKNTNSYTVTFLEYDSPLDLLGLKLGLFEVTPEGEETPLDMPKVYPRRVWPPSPASLQTLQPGNIHQAEIDLQSLWEFPEVHGKKLAIVLKGSWTSVWAKAAADISQEELESAGSGPSCSAGSFESPVFETDLEDPA